MELSEAAPISCGAEHAAWRYVGPHAALKGRMFRVPRRPRSDRILAASAASSPLQQWLGESFVHSPLMRVLIEREAAAALYAFAELASRGLSNAPADVCTCAAAVRQLISTVFEAMEGQVALLSNPHDAVEVSVEMDHTRMIAPSPGSSSDAFCVELKPKCGVMPREPLSFIVPSQCRHCLFIREKESRLNLGRSDFCPIDLYSEEPCRIRQAVRALVNMCALQLQVPCAQWNSSC